MTDTMNSIVRLELLIVQSIAKVTVQTSVGKWILKNLFWPCMEPALTLVILFLRFLLGPLVRNLPTPIRSTVFTLLLYLSELMNQPFLVKPLGLAVTLFLLAAVPERYPDKVVQEAVRIFLTIGLDAEGRRMAARMGARHASFFPDALRDGPASRAFSTPNNAAATLRNSKIAETALLMSIMSYREDDEIRACLREGMFPNTSYYSVNTGRFETDMAIFVDQEERWAVFCYRGTEFDTLRDVATSAFIEEPVDFGGGMKVRSQYYKQMKNSTQTQLLGRNQTVLEFAEYLARRRCKIYCAGHSLGGGLASVFGSFLRREVPTVKPIIITFGSPPVAGNQAFVDWYQNDIEYSWRFRYGNEFAPMVPPVPFTSNTVLFHVPQLVEATDIQNQDPAVRDPQEVVKQVEHLVRTQNLTSLFFDHNPVLTLRKIQQLKASLS